MPWHILAPRRGCFSNHLPLRRVRIFAELFYWIETQFRSNKKAARSHPRPNCLNTLQEYRIDFIVLAGFLVRVPDLLLHAYPDKIINIHPALLPKFGGKGMYGDRVHQAVVAAGEKESGITIHYINEHYDEGDTIFRATCPVLPTDSPGDVAEKVHALEYEHFPRVIEQIITTL